MGEEISLQCRKLQIIYVLHNQKGGTDLYSPEEWAVHSSFFLKSTIREKVVYNGKF